MSFRDPFRNPLRPKLAANEPSFGLWVTMSDPSVVEIAVEIGVDWLVIDLEHGSLSLQDVVNHLRAAKGFDVAVLARVPTLEQEKIKRVLDLGVHGILIPNVRTAEDVENVLRHCKYPPEGIRGVGGDRTIGWGIGVPEYLSRANAEILAIPIIETREATENIESILAVQGIDAIFFGPADLSASLGHLGSWFGGDCEERIEAVRSAAAERSISSGIVARGGAEARLKIASGFRMIGLGSDAALLMSKLTDAIADASQIERKPVGFP